MLVGRFNRRLFEAIFQPRHACFQQLKNQRGSAAVDYAVILAFTVLVIIAVIVALQDRSNLIFSATTNVIGDFGSIPKE